MFNTSINTRTTVYADLLEQVRHAVRNGDYKPGDFVGTEHALCRQLGISRVSVRRATDQLIREGLIERRAGKGLFVRPPERKTRSIHIIVPDLAFEQCVQIVRGARLYASERGVDVQVHDGHNQMDRDINMLRSITSDSADGAIIQSWHNARFTESLLELKQKQVPFVLVDEHPRELEIDSITADNYGGGMMVGNALLDAGHRRIGFVGNLVADTVRWRLEGLRDAIGDRSLPFERSLVSDLAVQPQENWQKRIAHCTHDLLSRPDRPTAIFFSDDQVAAEAYLTIRAMGLRVPHDLSVAGFDDSPLCRWLEPALASVRQPSLDMGAMAMRMLLDVLSNPVSGTIRPSQTRTLPVEWVQRDSIANLA